MAGKSGPPGGRPLPGRLSGADAICFRYGESRSFGGFEVSGDSKPPKLPGAKARAGKSGPPAARTQDFGLRTQDFGLGTRVYSSCQAELALRFRCVVLENHLGVDRDGVLLIRHLLGLLAQDQADDVVDGVESGSDHPVHVVPD